MIKDYNALFTGASAQAITTTAASTSYYDRGAAADTGPGTQIRLFCNILTAFASATSLTVSLETDSTSGFGSATSLWVGPAILLAALTANTKINIPGIIAGAKRYLRFKFTVSGTENAGTIEAGVVVDDQNNTPTAGSP